MSASATSVPPRIPPGTTAEIGRRNALIAALLAVLWLKPMVSSRVKNELEVSMTQSITGPTTNAAESTTRAAGAK